MRSSPVRAARSRRALRGVVISVTLVLALAGCTRSGGVAAVVDGTSISVSDVQRAVAELGPVYQGATLPILLKVLIVGPTFLDVASKYGAGVSETQAVDSLKQAYATQKLAAPQSFGPGAITVARFLLANDALTPLPTASEAVAEATARAKLLHVEVSPRFGKLDSSTLTIMPLAYAWIVSDTPSAS